MPATVVVVDDDANARDILAEFLRHAGCEVFVANDGESGLSVVRGLGCQCVVLLDLHMPRMDGWEFMSALLEEPALAGTPVLVISGDIRPEKLPAGIAGAIKKPLDFDLLVQEVERLFLRIAQRAG